MAEDSSRVGGLLPQDATRWFTDLSILKKSVVALTVLLLMYGVIGFTYFASQRYLDVTRNESDQAYRTLIQSERVESQLLHEVRVLRTVLLADDSRQVFAYESEADQFDRDFETLRRLVDDSPDQVKLLNQLSERVKSWRDTYAKPGITLLQKRSAMDSAEYERQSRQVLLGAGRVIEDALKVLQQISDDQSARLQHIGTEVEQKRLDADRLVYIMLLFGLLVGLTVARFVRTRIGEPLSGLTHLMSRISNGDSQFDIPHLDRHDEVGAFAQALASLKTMVASRDRSNWVKIQVTEAATALQGCTQHLEFGTRLLERLCTALNAGYGVAYRWDDAPSQLIYSGGYAVPSGAETLRFRIGQGLVGQALAGGQMLEINNVPADSFRISSGALDAPPKTLLLVPLAVREDPIAVLELALIGELEAEQRELLSELGAAAALIWQTLNRGIETRELLDRSQEQGRELRASEEALRVQQEELRATNETLRERTQLLEEQKRRLRASEEELRAQTEELRVANTVLTERTDALKLRQAELEQARIELEKRAHDLELASRYKSEFLANMSHELRTPLNSLLILSQSLAENDAGHLDAEEVESARIVHDSGRNLLNLINDILDLSKVEAGKMQLVLEDLSLNAFAAAQERNFRHVAQSRQLEFLVELEPGLPQTIHTDGTRLGQVVVNLLSNAFKFTEQGTVRLRIARPAAEDVIRLQGLEAEHAIAISITDSGIGITGEQLDRIFHPFEQADGGTSRRFGGTGLGLSIVRGMAQLLGGEVQVRSTPGKGSTFTIVIPEMLDAGAEPRRAEPARINFVSEGVPEPAANADADADRALRGGHDPAAPILIVEDDQAFARIVEALAQRQNIQTVHADSGQAALSIAQEQPLAGVLLDLGLPDMSGWEVLARLKANSRTRDLPVHIVSASDETSRTAEAGAIGFLVKPASRDEVIQAMSKVTLPAGPDKPARRVLLVDDDANARLVVRRMLQPETSDVVEVSDGAAATHALQAQGPFDCVILDLGLPDVSGFDWLDQTAREGKLPPVVIYSARELTPEESLRLREHTESIVIKGARSPERLLDEVSLFLHALKREPQVPAAPPLSDARPNLPAAEPDHDVSGRTILVVDDDMRNVFALSKALRARQLKVIMAQDGYKALTQLEANSQIDLVLMDIMMPGMDGYETIRRIREHVQWKQLPIIAVTAKAMKGDREKCLEVGANDYCPKPIDVDQLMSQIRVWI